MPPMTTVTLSCTGVVVVGLEVPIVVLAVVVDVDGHVGPVIVVKGDVVSGAKGVALGSAWIC